MMKNIHILPTDKPSRLYLGDNGNFVFGMMQTFVRSKNESFTNQNLYITSDEEIKEGDWLLIIDDFETYIHKHKGDNLPTTYHKKIILTTDAELIKDGVQDISDEFLEWFVKNPNSKEVISWRLGNYSSKYIGYIEEKYTGGLDMGQIIPKEEPKTNKI